MKGLIKKYEKRLKIFYKNGLKYFDDKLVEFFLGKDSLNVKKILFFLFNLSYLMLFNIYLLFLSHLLNLVLLLLVLNIAHVKGIVIILIGLLVLFFIWVFFIIYKKRIMGEQIKMFIDELILLKVCVLLFFFMIISLVFNILLLISYF